MHLGGGLSIFSQNPFEYLAALTILLIAVGMYIYQFINKGKKKKKKDTILT